MQLFQEVKPTGKKLLSLCECYIQNYLDKVVIDPRKVHQIRKHRTKGSPIVEREKKKNIKKSERFPQTIVSKTESKRFQ